MSAGPILYPNVTSIPKQGGTGAAERPQKKQEGVPSDFDRAFDEALVQKGPQKGTVEGAQAGNGMPGLSSDLSQVKAPLKFSAHAAQRLQERKITLDPGTMAKVNEAIDKAEAKGIDDTLVLTKDAALIVNVKNRTVITAMDRGSMTGNVFTNIDGAVVV